MLSPDKTRTMPRLVAVDSSVMRVRAFAQWAHGQKLVFERPPLEFLDDVATAVSELDGAPESLVVLIKAAYLHRIPLDTDVPDVALEYLFPATVHEPESPATIAVTAALSLVTHADPKRRLEAFHRVFQSGSLTRCLSLCERFTRAMWGHAGRLPATVLDELRAEHHSYSALVRVLGEHEAMWEAYEEAIGPLGAAP
jgi:hypothetical protein